MRGQNTASKNNISRRENNKKETWLWLDDLRQAPENWTWVKTVDAAKQLFLDEDLEVTKASLDHDLGENIPEGYQLCLWMASSNIWPSQLLQVHSQNAVGAERMCGVIERYATHLHRRPLSRLFTR